MLYNPIRKRRIKYEKNNTEAKSNDLIISKEVDSKKQQNQTTYDPDDYLYKYYYETLLSKSENLL